jgi:basic membrane lipoprotein Med (substrate-binding protein (PBP1-ABC) superfamily)
MKAAAAAEPKKVKVSYQLSHSVASYPPEIQADIAVGCRLIVTVGSNMAQTTESFAKTFPKAKFAIVACSYHSHCLTGKKLKNIASVKGTVKAVKTLVLTRANGT